MSSRSRAPSAKPSRNGRPPQQRPDTQFVPEDVPWELAAADRWIHWEPALERGKWKKPPRGPSGGAIDPFDPAHWMSLEAAREVAHRGGDRFGLGFSLGRDGCDDLVALDFDHCIEEGKVKDTILRLVRSLDSYTEITPSGDGLRVWVRGSLPTDGRKNGKAGIEVYIRSRYLTVTGRHLPGTPTEINHRQEALAALWGAYFGGDEGAPPTVADGNSNGHADGSDDELLSRARQAKNGAKFTSLFDNGDASAYGDDESRADQALMDLLAFWSGKDASRMEALFGRSALGQRPKWTNRPDYRQRTIQQAIDRCGETYRPRAGRNGKPPSTNGNGNGNGNGHAADRATPGDGGGYILGARGNLISCATNSKIWLGLNRPDDFARHDRFRQTILIGGEPLSDVLVTDLAMEIEASLQVPWAQDHVRSALVHLANRRAFSSLVEWFGSLRWDGVGRIESFFADHYECEDSEYSREVGRVFFLGATARAYEPGCKVDTMPVLMGAQGIGKSFGMAALCPDKDWFADELGGEIGTKRAAEGLAGKWLVELGELAALRRSEVETIKSFISRQSDRYRPPWGRSSQDFPRSCVFIGTTNSDTPLQDTENRRFLPLKVVQANVAGIVAARQQLWAEAAVRYKAGEKWWTTSSHLLQKIRSHLDAARAEDAWETILRCKLDRVTRTTTLEAAELLGLWHDSEGRTDNKLKKGDETRIGIALKAIGFTRARDAKPPRDWYYTREIGPTC